MQIRNKFTGKIIFDGDKADLRGVDLHGADLRRADLCGAGLSQIKSYSESHDIFTELVKRQKPSIFKNTDWAAIGQIVLHRPCWDTIITRYPKASMRRIFRILAANGHDEYLIKYEEEIKK